MQEIRSASKVADVEANWKPDLVGTKILGQIHQLVSCATLVGGLEIARSVALDLSVPIKRVIISSLVAKTAHVLKCSTECFRRKR